MTIAYTSANLSSDAECPQGSSRDTVSLRVHAARVFFLLPEMEPCVLVSILESLVHACVDPYFRDRLCEVDDRRCALIILRSGEIK
jgi:hypothetical protein